MKHNMFVIRDKKAMAYLPPFILPNDAMAIRTFGDCINDPKHKFGQHPEDYSLYSISTFEDCTGKLDVSIEPLLIVTGIDLEDGTNDDAQIELTGVN